MVESNFTDEIVWFRSECQNTVHFYSFDFMIVHFWRPSIFSCSFPTHLYLNLWPSTLDFTLGNHFLILFENGRSKNHIETNVQFVTLWPFTSNFIFVHFRRPFIFSCSNSIMLFLKWPSTFNLASKNHIFFLNTFRHTGME